MYLFFFSGFFQIVFDISIIFPQSFLDLEYAILEVGAKEEPTKPPREELDITRWKKIKIKKKKRRNKKLKEMIAAELLARNSKFTGRSQRRTFDQKWHFANISRYTPNESWSRAVFATYRFSSIKLREQRVIDW